MPNMTQDRNDSTATTTPDTQMAGIALDRKVETLPNAAALGPATQTSSQQSVKGEGTTFALAAKDKSVRFVVNVRTVDSAETIRRANELLSAEVKTSPSSTSEK
jgi:hypothetical protein